MGSYLRKAVRNVKKEQRSVRRDYKRELKQAGVPSSERRKLLKQYDKECRKQVRQFKREFRRAT